MEAAREFPVMRILVITLCSWFSVMFTTECVTVEPVPIYQSSPSKIRITAFLNGKPVENVRIAVLSVSGPQPRASISTDRYGVATTAQLPPGRYQVVATGVDDL